MKRILQFISCLLFVFFSINANSQTDELNPKTFLKDYRPPNFTYKIWSFSPDLRESSSNSDNFKKSQFNARLINNFNLRQQKDNSNTTLNISTNNEFRRGNVNDIKNGNDNFFHNNITAQANRDLFFNDKFLIGIGTNYQGQFERELIEEWDAETENDLSINLSLGFGRIFGVTDAWRATSLYNDLECNGIAADQSYLKELSDLLTMQNNRRIFDSRLARIQNRTELYTFIQENEITEFTPFSVSVINDSYRFETFRQRLSGYRFALGIQPGIVTETIKDSSNKMASNWKYILPVASFNYHLPVNEDWQLDILSSFQYKNLLSEEIYENTVSNVSVSIAWMPNARIRSSSSLVYRGSDGEDVNFNSISLGYQFNYYFSPRMVANASAVIGKTWSELNGQQNNDLSQRITIGFNYLIF